jgi:hypothetical protein
MKNNIVMKIGNSIFLLYQKQNKKKKVFPTIKTMLLWFKTLTSHINTKIILIFENVYINNKPA